jgi:hypothetical protein
LQPGNYTAILAGKDGGTGIGVVEVYDLATNVFADLTNVSTRGFVGTGQAVLILAGSLPAAAMAAFRWSCVASARPWHSFT